MTRKTFIKRAALPAAALAAGLAVTGVALLSSAPATASGDTPNRLQMYIQNWTSFSLAPVDWGSLHKDPPGIAAGQTGEVKANANVNVTGHVTYAYNQPWAPSCSVTLRFEYDFDASKYQCKNKQFTMVTNQGTCTLQRQSCYNQGCECQFTFTQP